MTETLLAAASAFWLGVLTSVSPCPLATNIAAISYVGRRLDDPRKVVWGGVLYTLGRALAYGALGALLVAGLTAAPALSQTLQQWLNRLLGPLLVVVGMFLLDLIAMPGRGSARWVRLQERMARGGLWGAPVLGALFALSFCPLSAALFFGSLVPLALARQSGVLLPVVYGVGTGLPVLVVAVAVSLGMRSVGRAFDRLAAFDRWARLATGVVFVGVGGYLTLVYVFGVLE